MNTRPQLFELFEKSIEGNHAVEKKSEWYHLKENEVLYKFKTPSIYTTGFRIEINELKLFNEPPKDIADKPPKGIAKMCDALFVVQHNGNDFIIAVEIKTKCKDDYKKQLHNGCRFCEWLVQLFKDHDHYFNNPHYIGLLIKEQNPSQPHKNTTAHSRNEPIYPYGSMKIPIYKTHKTVNRLQDFLENIPNPTT